MISETETLTNNFNTVKGIKIINYHKFSEMKKHLVKHYDCYAKRNKKIKYAINYIYICVSAIFK